MFCDSNCCASWRCFLAVLAAFAAHGAEFGQAPVEAAIVCGLVAEHEREPAFVAVTGSLVLETSGPLGEPHVFDHAVY